MSSLADILGEGFDKHAVALAAKPLRARAPGIIGAIRRRRAARAAAASGVSVLAIGAIAFGTLHWWPPATLQPADAPSWCDLTTYPQVNPEALGAFGYAGRIWANGEDNVYVYVAPDGSHTTLEPDAGGTSYSAEYEGRTLLVPAPPYPTFPWKHMVHDFATDGSASGTPYAVGPDEMPYYGTVTPVLMYEWTTVAPSEVPPGVDEFGIAALQLSSLGFDVSLGERGYVPAGASLEQVTRWTDGRERVVPVPDGEEWLVPPVGGADLDGLASVALRAGGLQDGESYEVVSRYDPSKTWATACGTVLSAWPTEPPLSNFNWGPYFEGPESAAFQCHAALRPEDEDVITLTIEVGSGLVQRTFGDGGSLQMDLGTEGSLVELTVETLEVKGDPQPMPLYPGWYASWHDSGGGTMRGAMVFGALAWLDSDGRVVGREVLTADEAEVRTGPASPDTSGAWDLLGGRTSWVIARKDAATAGVACDGIDASALATASVVWIQGVGPDADHMTWSWTRVGPLSAS